MLASCASRNPETVTAALRLVGVILGKHHSYALSSLLKTVTFESEFASRSPGAIPVELDSLITIVTDIAGPEGINKAYENSIKDSIASLEAHPCSGELLAIGETDDNKAGARGAVMNEDHPKMRMHSLSAKDPFLKQLVSLLRTFFTNDIETNLGLTSAITHLALCPFVRLHGWLCASSASEARLSDPGSSRAASSIASSPSNVLTDPDAQEAARIRAYKACLHPSTDTSTSTPPLILALHHLTHTLIALKHDIPDFTHLLAGRKRAFQGLAELEDEMLNQQQMATTPSQGILTSPRGSIEQSREQSRTRPIPVPTLSPSPSTQPAGSQTRSTSPRGRTLSILAGHGSPRSTASPRPLQSPIPFGSPSSFGASTAFRPQLREETQRRASRSPIKASRTMSPLVAESVGSGRSGRSVSPVKSPIRASFDQAVGPGRGAGEEIFDRRIRFTGVGEYITAESTARSGGERAEDTSPEGIEHNEGKDEEDDTDAGEYREASLTHVLTNAVILQEFVLELAAIIHVRAGLLDGEVSFGT